VTLRLEVAPRPIGAAMLFLWLALSACASDGPAVPEGVFLPSLTGAPPHYPSAAIGGTLVEDRDCLELRDPYLSAEFAPPSPGAVVLLLWPEGSRATRTEGGGLRVDAPDLPAAVTGRDLFIGGMFTSSLEDAEQKIGEPIPAACRIGLYWVATEQS
jgi:hypothetical protein